MDLYFQAWSKGFTLNTRAMRTKYLIFLLTYIFISENLFAEVETEAMVQVAKGIAFVGTIFLISMAMLIIKFLYKKIVNKINFKEKQEKAPNTSIFSGISAAVNHSKDTVSQIKLATVESEKREENIFHNTVDYEINEDEIYAQAMTEIEEDKKAKGTWAKALVLSEGDTSKETSLYIKLRVNDIIEQKKKEIHNIDSEKQKIQAQRDSEVWLDSDTGLMWEMKTEENIGHKYVWSQENVAQAQNPELLTDDVKDAFSYADKLNSNGFGGYDDWRVPTLEELKTLLTKKKSKNKGFENKNYFIKEPLSKNSSNSYWSSTWIIDFYDGNVYLGYRDYNYCVRCVRAGQ